MAIYVLHRQSGQQFILLSANKGILKTSIQQFPGSTKPVDSIEEYTTAAVSDKVGNILFFDSRELIVIQIDGFASS